MDGLQRIVESIKCAEKVLVGIGNEFDVDWQKEGLSMENYEDSFRCRAMLDDLTKAFPQDGAYRNLKALLDGKDYYMISLAMDDAVFRVFDREDKIVAPCGGLYLMQCAAGCSKALMPYRDGMDQKCPVCGADLVFNNLYAENYLEEGYLEKFADYKKWLQTTINKKLCILELGAGMRFPGIIRFAFDKMAYYNQKCEFYRIHETLYQHTAENRERGISIAENALSFMKKKEWEQFHIKQETI